LDREVEVARPLRRPAIIALAILLAAVMLGCEPPGKDGGALLVLPAPATLEVGKGSLRVTLSEGTPFRLVAPDTVWTSYPTVLDPPPPVSAFDASGVAALVRELSLRCALDLEVIAETGDGWRLTWGEGPRVDAPGGRDAYRLAIDSNGLTLAAGDAPGLFYGVQTLRQLLRSDPPHFPALVIDDAPAYPYRGLLIDITRGRVPTMATLRDLVDRIAEAKLNLLMLYFEFAFAFPSHPDIGQSMGQLTPDEARELSEYARTRHVEVVPALQTLGHSSYLLHLPAYRHLAEDPDADGPWMLSPALDETYELLGDLVGDVADAFDAPHFNICADEPRRLGQNRSRPLAERMGRGGIFARHVGLLDRILGAAGRRTLFFADILEQRPEVLRALPRDAILLNWHYLHKGPIDRDRYPLTKRIADAGYEQWVCPAVSDWRRLYPDLPMAVDNIATFAGDGIAHGATGFVVTSWGDHGGENLLAGNWYGLLFAAEQAWRPRSERGDGERAGFHRRFAWHRYRLEDTAIADAMWELGGSNEPFRFWYGHNLSRNHDLFFRQADAESLLASIYSPEARRRKADAVRAAADRALGLLERVPDPLPPWQERLTVDRDWMELACRRAENVAVIATLLADEETETRPAHELVEDWEAVAGAYPPFLERYRELWLRETREESFGWEVIAESYRAAALRCHADAARLGGDRDSDREGARD
jgi:hypothetical protein